MILSYYNRLHQVNSITGLISSKLNFLVESEEKIIEIFNNIFFKLKFRRNV